MNDLALNIPAHKKLEFTGYSSAKDIRLAIGKYAVTTFSPQDYLKERLFGVLLILATIPLYAAILYLCQLRLLATYIILSPAVFVIAFFLSGFLVRNSPLRGIHGAEHMTIRAIESRQPLTKELIWKQSPISDNCGTMLTTNVMLLALTWCVFAVSTVSMTHTHLPMEFRLKLLTGLLAGCLILAFLLMKPLGRWYQKTFFVSRPNESQLNLAYEQGLALIRLYNDASH